MQSRLPNIGALSNSCRARSDFLLPSSQPTCTPPAALNGSHTNWSSIDPLQPGITARPAADTGHATVANTKLRRKQLHTTAAVMDLPATDSSYQLTPQSSPHYSYLRCDEINRLILNSAHSAGPDAILQLSAVVQQYATLFNRVNVATAIHVLAKIVCGTRSSSSSSLAISGHQHDEADSLQDEHLQVAKQLLDSYLLPLFHRKMLAMQPRDVASCMWALGRLEHYPSHAFMHDTLLHVLQSGTDTRYASSRPGPSGRPGDFIRKASPQDWSMLTWGLARLQKLWTTLPSSPQQDHLTMAQQAPSLQEAFGTGASTAGAMSVREDTEATQQLPAWVQEHMHQVKTQHITPALLSALTQEVFTAVASAAAPQLEHFAAKNTTHTPTPPTHAPNSSTAGQHVPADAKGKGEDEHLLSRLLTDGPMRGSRWESEADRIRLELSALLSPAATDRQSASDLSRQAQGMPSSVSATKSRDAKRGPKPSAAAFMPLTLSSLAYSYATVPHPDSVTLVARICSIAQEQVESFSPAELADIMWAAASLQLPHAAFFKVCLPQLAKLAATMQPQELATALWACSRLGLQYPTFTCAAAKAAVNLKSCMPPRLLVRVVGALAKLQCEEATQMRELLDSAHDVLDQLEPQELVHVMQACALLKLQHPAAPEAASHLIRSNPPTPLPLLVEAARAATRLNHKYVYSLLRAATKSAASQPSQLTPRLVTNLLWVAASCGGVREPHSFFPATRMAMQRCIQQMQPVQLAVVFAALAKMDHYDAALVTSLCRAVRVRLGLIQPLSPKGNETVPQGVRGGDASTRQDKIAEFDGEQAALALWALGHLRHYEADVVDSLMEVCQKEAQVVGQSTGSRGGGLWDRVADIMEGVCAHPADEGDLAGPTSPHAEDVNNILPHVAMRRTTHELRTVRGVANAVPVSDSTSGCASVGAGTDGKAQDLHESESPAPSRWLKSLLVWSGLRLVRSGRADPIGFQMLQDLGPQVHLDIDRIDRIVLPIGTNTKQDLGFVDDLSVRGNWLTSPTLNSHITQPSLPSPSLSSSSASPSCHTSKSMNIPGRSHAEAGSVAEGTESSSESHAESHTCIAQKHPRQRSAAVHSGSRLSENADTSHMWMEPRRLCRLLRTCSVFGMRPDWLLDLAQQLLEKNPNAFSTWTLCRLAGSLALLEVDDVKVFQRIIELLHSLCGGNMSTVLPPAALAQLLRAHITVKDLTGEALLSESQYPGLLTACTQAALVRRRRSSTNTSIRRSFVPTEVLQVTSAIHALSRRPRNDVSHRPSVSPASHSDAASTTAGPSTSMQYRSGMEPARKPEVAVQLPSDDSSRQAVQGSTASVDDGSGKGLMVVDRPVLMRQQGSVSVRGGLFEVDAVVRYAGETVAVVVHLPQHFTRTQPPQLVGFEHWRLQRLKGEFNGRVVTVPWFEVAGMDGEDMRLCLQQYLDECVMGSGRSC